jgi:hypothetical protein
MHLALVHNSIQSAEDRISLLRNPLPKSTAIFTLNRPAFLLIIMF